MSNAEGAGWRGVLGVGPESGYEQAVRRYVQIIKNEGRDPADGSERVRELQAALKAAKLESYPELDKNN